MSAYIGLYEARVFQPSSANAPSCLPTHRVTRFKFPVQMGLMSCKLSQTPNPSQMPTGNMTKTSNRSSAALKNAMVWNLCPCVYIDMATVGVGKSCGTSVLAAWVLTQRDRVMCSMYTCMWLILSSGCVLTCIGEEGGRGGGGILILKQFSCHYICNE